MHLLLAYLPSLTHSLLVHMWFQRSPPKETIGTHVLVSLRQLLFGGNGSNIGQEVRDGKNGRSKFKKNNTQTKINDNKENTNSWTGRIA